MIAYPAALIAGVMTSLTPCIYPVIPITIGYIGARSAGSRARAFFCSISYVFGMAVVYSALGCIAALTGRVFGQISTSPLAYLAVANISIILGLSMFDLFQLRLPSFLSSRKFSAGAAATAGLPQAFAVGLASGLVVGPCTAPVLALILSYVATKQNIVFGTTILFTFAFGMGLLLIALGTFTGLLTALPSAGPWLTKIKRGFGWVLIFAGQYFLFMAGRLSV